MKRVLLIQNAYAEVIRMVVEDAATDFAIVNYYLKLSQEIDLTPGLLLPVVQLIASHTAAAADPNAIQVIPLGQHLAGTIFAPRFVGIRAEEQSGTLGTHNVFIHLDYEVIEVPWMDWLMMWDFLDNITDNSREY